MVKVNIGKSALGEFNSISFENCHSAVFNQSVYKEAERLPHLSAPLFVVDDDEVLAQYTSLKLMRELGVACMTFSKMSAALDEFILRPNHCAGLITDVFMEPCVEHGCFSGMDLARRFIAYDKPVLFLTSLSGSKEKSMFMRLGYFVDKERWHDVVADTLNGERTMLQLFLDAASHAEKAAPARMGEGAGKPREAAASEIWWEKLASAHKPVATQ